MNPLRNILSHLWGAILTVRGNEERYWQHTTGQAPALADPEDSLACGTKTVTPRDETSLSDLIEQRQSESGNAPE